jgi:outer membrane protein assembly factor BamB
MRLLPLLLLATIAHAVEAPYGHQDFYPSPERPVGFRGDGSGDFPGATPVSEWRDGTVQPYTKTGQKGKFETLITTDEKAHNIVWRTEMPGWGNGQPTVVGDRVYTTSDPDQITCTDAHTGEIRWSKRVNIFAVKGCDAATAAHCQVLLDLASMTFDLYECLKNYGKGSKHRDTLTELVEAMIATVLPRIGQLTTQAGAPVDPKPIIEGLQQVLQSIKTLDDRSKLDDQQFRQLGRSIEGLTGWISKLSGIEYKDVPIGSPWGTMIGFQAAAPVSDGRHVYVSFGRGATVCYDLDGKEVWSRFLQLKDTRRSTCTLQAPLLADGVLVDTHGGAEVLRGLDASTGKTLWEARTQGELPPRKENRGGYYVANHQVIRLPDAQGRPVAVLMTTLCNLIRIRDGKVLGMLPYDEAGPGGGCGLAFVDGVAMKACSGDYGSSPLVAWKLAFSGPEAISATELWRHPKPPDTYFSLLFGRGVVFMEGRATDPATGKERYQLPKPMLMRANDYIRAGDLILTVDDLPSWDDRAGRYEGKAFSRFNVARLQGDGASLVSEQNVLATSTFPRHVEYDTYAPELRSILLKFPGTWAGIPAFHQYADNIMFPSGNRLFIRTLQHLYCIGDPAVKYDWNPATRRK